MTLETFLAFQLSIAETFRVSPFASLSYPISPPKTNRQSSFPNSCYGKGKREEEERKGEKGKGAGISKK